jgi:NADPH-dependent ferric siderophore reductase
MTDTPKPMPPRRPPPRRAVVSKVERLAERIVRVTFSGEPLSSFAWNGPGAYLKLILPEEGQSEPTPPSPDGPRPTMRNYTPRRFDAEKLELEVEFVLHGHGPASKWAAQAEPGQVVLIGGPGPSYKIDENAVRYVIAGDESALPAIETILEALPATAQATVLIEVASEQDIIPLSSAASFDAQWLIRKDNNDASNLVLEQSIKDLAAIESAEKIYVACEAKAVRRIRAHLLNERGVAADNLVTRGYWQRGEVNHTDHDYGIDGEDGKPIPPQRRG